MNTYDISVTFAKRGRTPEQAWEELDELLSAVGLNDLVVEIHEPVFVESDGDDNE